ncbi:hypothetical protein THRCLA_22160, partial [Thraustotheca clavata]
MYWAFANDLNSVVNSPLCFYKHTIYIQTSIINPTPWPPNYIAQESFFGPFGSIDVVYVGVPDLGSLKHRLQEYTSNVNNLTNFISLPPPKTWAKMNFTSFE